MKLQSRHSLLDRLLHRVAFASMTAQCAIADLENRLYRRELAAVDLGSPVLITALPRAGTTIMLELLAGTPTFASHTYRDLPFLLAPLIWQRLSGPFRRSAPRHERMHGDGIQITHDSPEAFEEVLWRRFWPRHYRPASIEPWTSCDHREFAQFLAAHMRKVVALRARAKPAARRYLSKNNANVARIPAIFAAVKGADMLVMFRDPLQQAASLLRQHLRFTTLHREVPFTRSYMAAIGHFDFGANLRPLNFDGWVDDRHDSDSRQLDYWLDYWRATYRHVLRNRRHEQLHLVCFEDFCSAADLGPLAACLSMDPADLLARQGLLRSPVSHPVAGDAVSAGTLAEAEDLYREMRELSVLRS